MPPSLLPPTPEELEELRLRRRASQLKGYGEGVDDPTAQALLNVRRNLGEAGRAVVGAKPYDETNPTGSYRAVQALMNAPTPAAIIPEAAQAAGKAATALSGLGALGVVKPKGGNWLAGSIERGLSPLKTPLLAGETPAQRVIRHEQLLTDPSVPAASRPVIERHLAEERSRAAIDNWLDTKLGKYIKNEMATPEDPVRALAERGITLQGVHPHDQRFADQINELKEKRISQGFPEEGMATTEAGRNWEAAADRVIDSGLAGDLIRFEYANPAYGSRKDIAEKYLRENPWLEKLDPKTPVYDLESAYSRLYEQTGFRHLIDELRNATDPDSGLPRSLQLSPEKLQKVTVPQAVELVDKINKWRAEQKVAADLKRSQNAATVEFKAYPQPNYFSAREPGSERFPGGFFTPDRAAAQKFGESFGKPVQGYVIEPRRTATEADVENVARRLGIYDEGVPADQYLTQGPEQIYSEAPQVIAELRNLGFDSARLNDGMSAQPSLVALDPNIVRPAIDNPKGLRWVELTLPSEQEDVSSMIIQNAGKYSILEPGQRLSWKDPASGRVLFDTPEKASAAYNRSRGVSALEESLKYEGETMGHCVGGYCPDVESGRSRIYSLRDAKGEPHVTVEVAPGPRIFDTGTPEGRPGPEKIVQIKGKANRAPKDEYLPFVQDFVRSGRWSDVKDVQNTGLIQIDPSSDLARNIRAAGNEPPKFVTQQELTEWLRQYHDPTKGFKKGGAVRMKDGGKPPKRRASDLPGYGEGSAADMLPAPLLEAARAIVGAGPSEPTNPSEVYRIAQTLANMSGVAPVVGGVVKGAKALKPAMVSLSAQERAANLAKFLEPSAVQMRLYHGTTATEGGKGQEAIRNIKPSKEGALGSGVYLTPKAQFASEYANPYIPGSTDFASGNVLPVYAQLRNPLVLEGKGDPMIEALTKLGIDEDKAARMVERAYENKGYIGKEVESRARAKGFDGLMQYRDGELSEVVSYNPNAIKSALGNEGAYDTSVPLLSKAAGGAVHLKKGGAVKIETNPTLMADELLFKGYRR